MEGTIQDKGILCKGIEVEGPIGEQKLWIAVLLQALQDWQSDKIRAHREAEQFLFNDKKDFETVCSAAGICASSFRARLSRLRIPSNNSTASTSQEAA